MTSIQSATSRLPQRFTTVLEKPILRILATTVASILLAFAYRRYAFTFPTHSDHAALLLEAADVLQGNPLLRHWYLTTVSFYTTDVPFMAAGVALRGLDPVLMSEVPAVMFLLTVAVALLLAGRRAGMSRLSLAGMATAFVLMALPAPPAAFGILRAPVHTGALLLVLVALAAIDPRRPSGDVPLNAADPMPGRLTPLRLIVFTLALALSIAGDTLALYVAAVPIALVCFVRLRRDEQGTRREDITVLAACIGAVILSKIIQRAIVALGGFTMPADAYSSNIAFVTFDKLGQNIAWTIEGLLNLYGADFFGMRVGKSALPPLLRLISVGLVLFSLGDVLLSWVRQNKTVDRISAILGVGMLINVAAYMFSSLPSGLSSTRYLFPFMYMGAILAGRYGLEYAKDTLLFRRLVAVTGVLALISFVYHVRGPIIDSPERRLGVWLGEHNLRDGYGGYWTSLNITAQSRGAVRVRQIKIADESGAMCPMLWAADATWYRDGRAINFVVLDSAAYMGLDTKAMSRAFGPPERRYDVEGYTVLVWNRDISPLLKQAPEVSP
jgi:hypothetical protein